MKILEIKPEKIVEAKATLELNGTELLYLMEGLRYIKDNVLPYGGAAVNGTWYNRDKVVDLLHEIGVEGYKLQNLKEAPGPCTK